MNYSEVNIARIVSAKITLTENELNEPYHVSLGTVTHIQSIVVQLIDEEGFVGLGEANPFAGFTAETHDECIEVLKEQLLPVVFRQENPNPWKVDKLLDAVCDDHLFGKAAISMALLDIMGKRLKRRVADLLGEPIRTSLPVLWPFSDQTPEKDIALINSKRKEGYHSFMLKMGSPPVDISASINRVLILDEYYAGQDVRLIADANGGWTTEQSIEFLDGVKDTKLIFVEQPVNKDDIDGMARLTASTSLAISADESLSSIKRAREIVERQAANVFSVKSSKNGGPIRAQAIAKIAEDVGVDCWMNSMPELGISQAASLQHAMIIPNLVKAGHAYMSTLRLKGDPTNFGSFVHNGVVHLPDAYGLGIRLDEGQLARIAISSITVSA